MDLNQVYEQFPILEREISVRREALSHTYLTMPEVTVGDYTRLANECPVTLDTYQEGVELTSRRNPTSLPKEVYMSLGLAGETGELVEIVKKQYRANKSIDQCRQKILDEAADVLYYLAGLVKTYNIKLSEVAKYGQVKSLQRFKEKYLKGEKE